MELHGNISTLFQDHHQTFVWFHNDPEIESKYYRVNSCLFFLLLESQVKNDIFRNLFIRSGLFDPTVRKTL